MPRSGNARMKLKGTNVPADLCPAAGQREKLRAVTRVKPSYRSLIPKMY